MQYLHSFYTALQKREVTEINQRTKMLEEQHRTETASISELYA